MIEKKRKVKRTGKKRSIKSCKFLKIEQISDESKRKESSFSFSPKTDKYSFFIVLKLNIYSSKNKKRQVECSVSPIKIHLRRNLCCKDLFL